MKRSLDDGIERKMSSPLNLNLTLKQRMEKKLGRVIVCNGPPSPRHQEERTAKKARLLTAGRNDATAASNRAPPHKCVEKASKDALEFWKFVTGGEADDSEQLQKKRKKGGQRRRKPPLSQLKRFARFFNYERAWQDVRSQHRGDLEAALENSKKEAHVFRQSVLDTKIKANQDALKISRDKAMVQKAYDACIHIVPSGSGCVIQAKGDGQGYHVLTCAHCIAADDDDDDEKERGQGDGHARPIERVGRHKIIVWGNGAWGLVKCIYSSERMDVAVCEILCYSGQGGDERPPTPHQVPDGVPCATVASASPRKGAPVFTIHNPFDWDLEHSGRPRRNGYIPFTTNTGKVDGYRRVKDRTDASEFGALKHSCWTYWGTSGAPIMDAKTAHVVGMHNSWDERNGQRHAVSQEALAKGIRAVLQSEN